MYCFRHILGQLLNKTRYGHFLSSKATCGQRLICDFRFYDQISQSFRATVSSFSRHTQTHTQGHTGSQRDTHRLTKTHTDKHRITQTHTQAHTHRNTHIDTHTQGVEERLSVVIMKY